MHKGVNNPAEIADYQLAIMMAGIAWLILSLCMAGKISASTLRTAQRFRHKEFPSLDSFPAMGNSLCYKCKKAGFLRLSQVCVRKHIPQLICIVYSDPVKNASPTEKFSISSFLMLNLDESRLKQHWHSQTSDNPL